MAIWQNPTKDWTYSGYGSHIVSKLQFEPITLWGSFFIRGYYGLRGAFLIMKKGL
jgi:hypothetical protein